MDKKSNKVNKLNREPRGCELRKRVFDLKLVYLDLDKLITISTLEIFLLFSSN